jgi:hypothetical protein
MIALRALGWILADPQRSSRFLALTGLEPDDLRVRIAEKEFHMAVLDYLAGHEADLISCAEELEIAPETIQAAAREFRA